MTRVRYALWIAAFVLAAACAPSVATSLVDGAASVLFESAPFVFAAVAAARFAPSWARRVVPFLSCGCSRPPAALSLPAAAASWLLFGPAIALGRLAAAVLCSRLQKNDACAVESTALVELAGIVPFAAGAAAIACATGAVPALRHLSVPIAFAAGCAAAFLAAPCGIGAVALAGSLRAASPPAAYGFLCIAGLADLRTFVRRSPVAHAHDAVAYASLAAGCALVAIRNGAGLVHPHFTAALWACAVASLALAIRFRRRAHGALRGAPALMLAGAVFAAPAPQYHATETTLSDAFPGERVDFTGLLTRTGSASTLVRYAITCCRADAAPVVLRLERAPRDAEGWMHARGVLEGVDGRLRLRADSLHAVRAPADPFVYR